MVVLPDVAARGRWKRTFPPIQNTTIRLASGGTVLAVAAPLQDLMTAIHGDRSMRARCSLTRPPMSRRIWPLVRARRIYRGQEVSADRRCILLRRIDIIEPTGQAGKAIARKAYERGGSEISRPSHEQ